MQRILAVCGVKHSGKTTLVCRLTGYFREQGLRVAVIKHDGHDFSCDVPGTDTYAFREAGACGIACFSAHRAFVHRVEGGDTERELIALFPEADLIILEGLKDREYPKIEVVRRENGNDPVSNPEGRFLIATDRDPAEFAEPAVYLDDIGAIAEHIRRHFSGVFPAGGKRL